MQNLIGQSLGRYHIIEKLGEGGMAVVYKAYDTRLERDVALKVIRKDAFPPNIMERMLKRFEREAKAMAKLAHTNIVKVMDYGEHDGNPYFVMELVPGGTLKERLGSPIPWQEAVSLVEPIARALAYAHGEHILHRDVKPANILITKTGEPVLTDFGIAKLLESDEGNTLTGTGVGVGTPEYMAPEQGMGKEVDGRADVYALGIVLFELVTGHKPYSADTPLAVMLKQVHDPLPEPRGFVPGLPDSLEKLLYKALAKNPDDRYQSMDDFVCAIQKLQDQPASKKIQLPTKKTNVQAEATELDGFATTDQLEVEQGSRSGRHKQKKASLSGGGSKQTVKIAGIALGGLAVVVLIIGAASGWFTPKTQVATEVPIITEKPANEESANESTLGIGSTTTSEVDSMTQVYVPAGEFLMGSVNGVGEDDEHPQHQVYLDGFWIDQTEITNAMYEDCVSAGACTEPRMIAAYARETYYQNPDYADYPVINVTWDQANIYCAWTGRRLPTEAEWEKAARGTEGNLYPWGEGSPDFNLANYASNIGDLTKVGSYPAGTSPYGALDMAGNAQEWVADLYAASFFAESPTNNPTGADAGSNRVLKGSSWSSDANALRVADRDSANPGRTTSSLGFRCATDTVNTAVVTNPSEPLKTDTESETAPGIGSTLVSEKDGMTMVYVPAGEFTMGSPDGVGEDDEHPQHQVYLDAFWIDQTEVTNEMFSAFLNDQGNQVEENAPWWNEFSVYNKIHNEGGVWVTENDYDNHPVVSVNWYGARAYCEWAGRKLPTEAQWEKAARGIEGNTYPWGEEQPNSTLANFIHIVGNTTAAGTYPKGGSPYYAFDMAGNVWEWTADWEGEYPSTSVSNPTGPSTGENRILRGGSYFSYANYIRSTERSYQTPNNSNYFTGFRCAMDAPGMTGETSLSAPIANAAETPEASLTPGIGSTMTSEKDGMTMVYVPAGEFLMGSPDDVGEDNEHPQHQVYLDAFWIDQTEVTNVQYAKCVNNGKCPEPWDYSSFTRESYYDNSEYSNYPVIWVSWNRANAYCKWAGRDLPTEAQWEMAARGTDGRTYPWGNQEPTDALANYGEIQGDTTAVGSYSEGASPYGALDMAGNVWEWVADSYGPYSAGNVRNPKGPDTDSFHVLRGGSWKYISSNIRSTYRDGSYPTNMSGDVGFRCVSSHE